MVTVLVIDSHGEGLPVAWCLANRTDSTVLMEFLKPLKERAGSIKTEVFMSDMAENFFNAWIGIFGRCDTKHLFCVWHVDKAWRKGLNLHIKNNEDRIKVYHCLRVLLQETDEASFQLKLQQTLSYLLAEYPDFYKYFNETYVPIASKWAYCFRVQAAVNTNMFVEAFHRKLKIVYLENKQNRRLDKLIFTLVKLSRDIIFEGLRKDEIGKQTHRKREISKRCSTAQKLKNEGVNPYLNGENSWSVQSSTRGDVSYTVSLSVPSCYCQLKCRTCAACVHMYTCTCVDYAVHYTVCKHVHLVHLSKQEVVSPEEADEELDSDNINLNILCELLNREEEEEEEVLTEQPSILDKQCDTCTGQPASSEEPSIGDEQLSSEQPSVDDEQLSSEQPSVGDEQLSSEQPSVDDEQLSSEQPSVGDEQLSSGTDYYLRILNQSERFSSVRKSKRLFEQKVAELRMFVDGCSDNDTIAQL